MLQRDVADWNAIPRFSGDTILPSFFERHSADGEDDVDLAGGEAELITRLWILKVLRRIAGERSSVGGKCSEHALCIVFGDLYENVQVLGDTGFRVAAKAYPPTTKNLTCCSLNASKRSR